MFTKNNATLFNQISKNTFIPFPSSKFAKKLHKTIIASQLTPIIKNFFLFSFKV